MPEPLCVPHRQWVTIQSCFLFLQTQFIYLLSGRQWIQPWLTNNLMMQPSCQDWIFLPPPSPLYSSLLQNISVSCQSFFPSHGPCWHGNPSLLTWGSVGHVGGHYYSWGSVIHSVTRCQQEVSVCTAAPFALFISQGWLMRSTRLIPPLEQQWL